MLRRRAPIQHIGVDGRANGAAFEVLDEISDHSKPLHALQGLLHPEVELAQVQVVGRVVARVVDALRIEDCQQPVILSQFSLDREAQTLRDLVHLHID